MKTVPAGEFRARCLQIRAADNAFGRLQGVLEIAGDVESPVLTPEDWEALR